MPTKRITLTYNCNHAGKKLQPLVIKDWDTTLPPGRVCWCVTDPEKNLPMPTPMTWTANVEENKPE